MSGVDRTASADHTTAYGVVRTMHAGPSADPRLGGARTLTA
ncbi:hypothetical protein [Streptomyces cucumeris]